MASKITDRIVKTLVLTNTSDKGGIKKLVFSDEDGNKYEYSYNVKNKFLKSVIPFEYLPSILKDKKFIDIAFRIAGTRYNPIGGKYIYNISYPKFIGVSKSSNTTDEKKKPNNE